MMQRDRRRPVKIPTFGTVSSSEPKAASSKRVRCGLCGPCLAPDCGKCEHCKRKKKFGGPGTSRQPCVRRKCVEIHGEPSAAGIELPSRSGSAPPPGVQVVNQRKEPPAGSRTSRGPNADGPERQGDHESSSDNNGKGPRTTFSRKKPPKRPFPLVSKLETSLLNAPKEDDQSKDTEENAAKRKMRENHFRRIFGKKIPPAPMLGVCAACGDDSKVEIVLLCDGQDCGREYHLSCANLDEVPSGDWFCVDCHPTGSGVEALADYLELMDDSRSEYDHSPAFVQALLQGDLQEANPKAPISELEKARRPPGDQSPERWIGKPIWIRVPKTAKHVPGRIVDHQARETAEQGLMEHAYYVRFAAGHYDRKEAFYHWIYLEEHQLMVGDRFVLARNDAKQQPALVYLRTSRELVAAEEPHRSVLQHRHISEFPGSMPMSPKSPASSPRLRQTPDKQGQTNRPAKSNLPTSIGAEDPQPVLVGYFGKVGDGKFESLLVAGTEKQRTNLSGTNVVPPLEDLFSPGVTTGAERGWPELAVAFVEHEEQENVRAWRSVPQGNPFHPSALKNRDFYCLPPLLLQDDGQGLKDSPAAIPGELHTQLCPLIPTGIDHQYVMNILSRNFPDLRPSKEVAAGLSCKLVPYKWPGGT